MEEKEATRTCSQCHKEVANANFDLHETHCSRFLCVCPDCGDTVPREQLEQHREEQHSQVRCSKCNQKMENGHLVDHQAEECEERLQTCHFCELELPWKDLDPHCLVCGSRTELCRDCGRYVTLREQPQHASTCSATSNGSGPARTTSKLTTNNTNVTQRCNRCMASFPAEDIEEHELVCVLGLDDDESASEEEESEDEGGFSRQEATAWLGSTYEALTLSGGASRGPSGVVGDPDQISTCPHCHLALPLATLRWHEVTFLHLYIC